MKVTNVKIKKDPRRISVEETKYRRLMRREKQIIKVKSLIGGAWQILQNIEGEK